MKYILFLLIMCSAFMCNAWVNNKTTSPNVVPYQSWVTDQINNFNYNTKNLSWSNPYDWRLTYNLLSDVDIQVSTSTNTISESSGRVLSSINIGTIKNNKAKLIIDYFDKVNMPINALDHYEVVSGPGVINKDIVTAIENGLVTVRAVMTDGSHRTEYLNMYQWKDSETYSNYSSDDGSINPNRKRVNDFHLSMLQQYRSNPNTNRAYRIWSEDGGVPLVGNTGDHYTGEYGKIWKPYNHKTSGSSGSCSWWWSHAPVSSHVLLAADHYGWNNTRTKTEYIGWQSSSNPGVKLNITNYVSLVEWAKAHGFPESDYSGAGDIGFHIVDTTIPDEYLPYIATADYLNSTYGASDKETAYIPCISLNQAEMVSIRAASVGTSNNKGWGSHFSPPSNGATRYDDGIIKDSYFREDIWQLVRLGGWHSVIMGDSGNPVYFYDPALVIEGTSDMRPVLMFAYHYASGGPAVPRYTKIIKAFVESIGDQLKFTLGDLENQVP